MKSLLKLGTRKSLLAWAQSTWVAREVERMNPGVRVELRGIETRGDRIIDIPLQNVEGKEFFVAEIDQALAAKEVDFTVHSMKDLSLERPAALTCAAIPKRENPRDVVLFSPDILKQIQSGRPLRIGTSSPRRIQNIPGFLSRALPKLAPSQAGRPLLEFVEIRGNVNTRLGRVHEPLGSPKHLDGVVLAFAGLIRLWADEKGRAELKKLLSGVRWMVLPLKECPAAAAQGALAIECRTADHDVMQILRKLHDEGTSERVSAERQLLADWGGGCHQRFGATAVKNPELGNLLFIRGVKPDGTEVDEIRHAGAVVTSPQSGVRAWNGSQWRSLEASAPLAPLSEGIDFKDQAVFVAHARAAQNPYLFMNSRIWTSGSASWFKLADLGLWVEGSAEGLGFDLLQDTLTEGVLQLPELKNWLVLTHDQALGDWQKLEIRAIPTYKINLDYGKDAKSALKAATHVFWSSGSQYDELKESVNQGVEHACGPGKTAAHLRTLGLKPKVYYSVEEWKRCLNLAD
jgi:hydroxymethylbilane synthase